jgi:hypothetical protein
VGIDVYLITEDGTKIARAGDSRSFTLARFLPDLDDSSFVCLRFVDPYGDAYFN